MADFKLNIAATNGAATKTTAINGSAPIVIDGAALKHTRAAALLLKAGPLPDTSADNLLQPLGATMDASASQIADDIAAGIKHEMALAIAHPDAALPADGFGSLARDLVAKAKPEKAAAIKQRAASQIAAPPAVQAAVFGRFAGKDAAAHADVAIKVSPEAASLFVASLKTAAPPKATSFATVEALQKGGVASFAAADSAPQKGEAASLVAARGTGEPASAASVARYKKLGFFITKVRCVRETSGWGSDEILLSGFGLDPSGQMMKPAVWKVSNDFDDGENVYPNPPRKFVEFDMSKPLPRWPRSYLVSIVLVEEDFGGFGATMQALWSQVGAQVSKKLADLAAEGINQLGTDFGTQLAPYTGKIIGGILDRILHWFQDDFLGRNTWTLGLWNDTKAYYDAIIHGTSAPPGIMRFTGDGSIYEVTVVWKVYN